MPKCQIEGCEKFTRNKVTLKIYCGMHAARIERHGYPELKQDAWRSLEKMPREVVDDFIINHWHEMKDEEMTKALRKKGIYSANTDRIKYRRRQLGFKKYLHGEIQKHKVWVRMQAIKKYGSACELCDYFLAVDTHHVIPRHEGGPHEVKNLMVLCPNCHALVTRRRIKIENRTDIPKLRRLVAKMTRRN